MRTTVNIDDHLLAEAKILAARTSRSLGAVLEDALRAMLRRSEKGSGNSEFHLPTHGTGGLQAGVDLDDKEALAELIGDNAAP
ncbi:type II toxin-antitoxin system VapB family antitoxin [Mycobacterium canetti]|uniref:type II toxin-antitoxin system VapB family antitoxin n=1 Tax=Mycobacterium canetti TaxID=78331 RepID=UPI00031F9A06|nr:type II toxin-antitoxin system VapB family antitoxin [Mycobacterium canetti]MBA2788204.1 type II toxin-antitoxin system VapB family antitoxin [Mycobacterium canetti]